MEVPLCVPDITEEDLARVDEVLRSGWLTHGPHTREFEAAFAGYLGVEHAVSMNSCASALYLAVLSLGIRGEIVMPSFTFVATANAAVAAGARPVFADVDYDTCNVDPAAVEAAITPRTEAIMPVHYAGQACDMDRLTEIARRHKLALIEDSAENTGGEFRGKKAGSFGIGCFSFYPTKNMTTGEGGMLTTDDAGLAETVRTYVGHGIASSTFAREKKERPWLRAATLPGYNFRLTNFQAALGLGQLERLDAMNARRREHAGWFTEHLRGVEGLDLPVEADDAVHVYQMYTVKLRGLDRTTLLAELRGEGVGASVHFDPPVHQQPWYAARDEYRNAELPVTDRVAASIVTLPLYPGMTEEQREHVRSAVIRAVGESRPSGARRAVRRA